MALTKQVNNDLQIEMFSQLGRLSKPLVKDDSTCPDQSTVYRYLVPASFFGITRSKRYISAEVKRYSK